MKLTKITPNFIISIISIVFGIFIFLKIPTEVEKPLLLFGQSSSEIDPKIVPSINQLSSVRARIMAPKRDTTMAGVQAATDIGILRDVPKTCIK